MTAVQYAGVPPKPDADSRDWWEGLSQGILLLPQCPKCGYKWWPPAPGCPACGGSRFELVRSTGAGSVYSWVVIHIAADAVFAADVPYTVLAVDLDDGPRLLGRLIGDDQNPLASCQRVRASMYSVSNQMLLGFERE
jgi:uncharacterized OB-fold protein